MLNMLFLYFEMLVSMCYVLVPLNFYMIMKSSPCMAHVMSALSTDA